MTRYGEPEFTTNDAGGCSRVRARTCAAPAPPSGAAGTWAEPASTSRWTAWTRWSTWRRAAGPYKERAEMLGGAIDTAQADKAHARLKRMAAFDSHDYDPADNDLEEDARRARKRADYKAEEQWSGP